MIDTSVESAVTAGESGRRRDGQRRCLEIFKKVWGGRSADIFFLLLTLLFLPGCSKNFSQMRMDAEMHGLCEKDGGIRVYETVRLPPEDFNKYGQIDFYHPTQGENSLGPEYIWKEETKTLHSEGDGLTGDDLLYALQLVRCHGQLYRRSDGKLLGEYISYYRRGGDSKFYMLRVLGGPPPTSDGCPEIKGSIGVGMIGSVDLFNSVFIKDDSRRGK